MVTMLALPTTGHVIAARSELIASATVKLAQTNPAVMRALSSVGGAGAYMELGTSAGAIVLALAVDRAGMTPDAMLPDMLGVTDSYLATHEDPDVANRVAAARAAAAGAGQVVAGVPPTGPPPPRVPVAG